MANYSVPGVYSVSEVVTPPAPVVTGVPAFIGFAALNGPSPTALRRKEDLPAAFTASATSVLADAVAGFFDNGGVRCYVVAADGDDPSKALLALDPISDLDLIAMPDAMNLADRKWARGIEIQRAMLAHCRDHGDRFAILDAWPGATQADVTEHASQLTIGQGEPINGALYYPWVRIPSSDPDPYHVPPCGHVAGIFARTDGKSGVFKAPANEEVFGILDLDMPVDAKAQGALNPIGINCLRAFPGRGIRVWGARTLSRQPEWRYVNVRRLFLTLQRWIDFNMTWTTLEPNDTRLWNRIRRELTVYLTTLWQRGAFAGESPDDSFYVKCDVETNPPESRDLGQVVTEIGLAPSAPAEFIVVRITQRATAA
jgi:phage tail sheath protein FI